MKFPTEINKLLYSMHASVNCCTSNITILLLQLLSFYLLLLLLFLSGLKSINFLLVLVLLFFLFSPSSLGQLRHRQIRLPRLLRHWGSYYLHRIYIISVRNFHHTDFLHLWHNCRSCWYWCSVFKKMIFCCCCSFFFSFLFLFSLIHTSLL